MKKLLALLLALSVCFVCFGCSKEKDDEKADDNKKTAVAEDTEKESSADKTTEAEDGEEKTTVADDDTRNEETKYDSLEALINSDEIQASFAAGVGEAEEYDVTMTAEGNTVIFKMKIKVEITEEQKAQFVQNIEGEDLWTVFSLDSLAKPAADLGFTDIQFKFVLEDKDGAVLYDEYIAH